MFQKFQDIEVLCLYLGKQEVEKLSETFYFLATPDVQSNIQWKMDILFGWLCIYASHRCE